MFLILLTVLQSLFSNLEQKTLQSNFTIAQTQVTQAATTYYGSLKMRGNKFIISMQDMDAAYDGKTLYVYSEDVEELTLTNPTKQELLETNPILYAKSLLPVCKYTEKVVGDKTQITLTPNNQTSGIKKFILRVTISTLLPSSIEIHETNGSITTLQFTGAKYTTENPSFKLSKPGAFINDLR
jgi:hypothetical protein